MYWLYAAYRTLFRFNVLYTAVIVDNDRGC
jgi:hypothetical protein